MAQKEEIKKARMANLIREGLNPAEAEDIIKMEDKQSWEHRKFIANWALELYAEGMTTREAIEEKYGHVYTPQMEDLLKEIRKLEDTQAKVYRIRKPGKHEFPYTDNEFFLDKSEAERYAEMHDRYDRKGFTVEVIKC